MTAGTREDRPTSPGAPTDGAAAAFAPRRPGAAAARLHDSIRIVRARMTLAHFGLLAALVVGAALRLIGLGRVGLNSDEAVYAGQAASLSGNPHFTGVFPVVRAHPLLVQMIASPLYAAGRPDVVGRYVVAAFGLGTIVMVYLLGCVVYRPRVAALAAILLAVMAYHVTISRQFLLDGPMTFFTTAALVCLAKAVESGERRWFVGAGACLGLAALCKETGLVLAIAALAFLCLYARAWRPTRFIVASAGVALGLTAAYPLITALSGGGQHGQSYLLWQLTRQPNHGPSFYPLVVGTSIGFVVLAVAAYGLAIGRTFSWREMLLLSWIAIPLIYFEVWPVKGFAYLAPTTPAVALLAARGVGEIARIRSGRRLVGVALAATVALGCVLVSAVPAIQSVTATPLRGLAGAGGTPGGRETGRWIAAHVPSTARFITIGPSMANLIRYYSGRLADGLSVSPNPLHRNPSYQAIINPDGAIRAGAYQYLVWDAYSAARSTRFAAEAATLTARFHAVLVHEQRAADGQALVDVYRVRVHNTRYSVAHPAPAPVIAQPDSATLYAGYSLSALLALGILGWAAGLGGRWLRVRGRRR